MKTSELTGMALNWAVAKCLGYVHADGNVYLNCWAPSTDWSQGGPIIEREKMTLSYDEDSQTYSAYVSLFRQRGMSNRTRWRSGSTPLVAAMRCYCCSKLGEFVDIPEELCQQ